MNLLAQRFGGVTAFLLIYTLAALPNFSLLALAQEPAPFEISLTPQADQAVIGQPFTYTIVVTNSSQQPVKDVFVTVRTPQGTVFANTNFANPKWLVSSAQRGQPGEIIWLTQEPFTPGETMTFDLVVDVLPELSGQQLVNEEYTVAAIGSNQSAASGPPILTQVVSPTPTPSPSVQATNTPIPTATSSPTPLAPANLSPGSSTPEPVASFTSVSQANTSIANAATAVPLTPAQNTSSDTSLTTSINNLAIVGFSLLILLIVGLAWLWKRR